jgi:hypothetical protein
MTNERTTDEPGADPRPAPPPAGTTGPGARRRPYAPPRLEALGDVRDLTLGGSPGLGDSGNPTVFQPPG